ncbi:MAG: class IV adenylate cyclase [Patescibacteria group bacterium]|nr:class IV adenylate cyclase [Patescibacteria group bacterium]
MQKIEKEIKIKINDIDGLIGQLLQDGATIKNKAMQKTVRFDTINENLEKKGVFLRVRSGNKNTITMKEKIGNDKNIRARKETEFEIEDIDKMIYIFKKIGFDYIKIMEKFRINLNYKNAILSIDELPFGFFLEIEGTENQINTISDKLNYSTKDKIIETYWDLFENYKKKKNIKSKNIIFPKNYISKILSLKY